MQTDRQRDCNNPSAYVRNCCIYIINPEWLGLMSYYIGIIIEMHGTDLLADAEQFADI